MSGIDFAVAALAVALVIFTIVHNVRKRMKGESTCGYCSGGAGCCAAKRKK